MNGYSDLMEKEVTYSEGRFFFAIILAIHCLINKLLPILIYTCIYRIESDDHITPFAFSHNKTGKEKFSQDDDQNGDNQSD